VKKRPPRAPSTSLPAACWIEDRDTHTVVGHGERESDGRVRACLHSLQWPSATRGEGADQCWVKTTMPTTDFRRLWLFLCSAIVTFLRRRRGGCCWAAGTH